MKNIYIAIVLLVFFSINSYAGTRGPIQPEYASFESPNNTDMVNLVTGDFSYTLPLINVPGPGGGYNMALGYHAGIELEEEASWVGLGWSLNAGALVRSINNIPDDMSGGLITTSTTGPESEGYVFNIGVYKRYYDSNMGKGGSVGLGSLLSVGFGDDAGFSVIGITYNSANDKVTADPVAIATNIVSVAMLIAYPPAGVVQIALEVGATAASEIAGALIANAKSASVFGNVTNQNYISRQWRSGVFNAKTHYSHKLKDPIRNEYRYGSLYLGNTPSSGPEVGAREPFMPKVFDGGNNTVLTRSFVEGVINDGAITIKANSKYHWTLSPTSIAYDDYFVNAPNITGNISPYRMDMGSLAFVSTNYDDPIGYDGPSQNSNPVFTPTDNVSYEIKPWLKETDILDGKSFKVPFKYTSSLSNSYTDHIIGSNTFNVNDDMKIEHEETTYNTNIYHNYKLKDSKFLNRDEFVEGDGYRPNQTLKNGKLATGNYVQYFTNNELSVTNLDNDNDPTMTVYQDHQNQVDRFRWRNSLPPKGIGGFVVTSSDGMSYHFTIPVYQTGELSQNGTAIDQYQNRENHNQVATSWLLTAITGADYIDRGREGAGQEHLPNGIIDDSDWGYRIKFNYGKFSSNYISRTPYKALTYSKSFRGESNNLVGAYSASYESYYLNSIETETHTAFFVKEVRKDGKGFYDVYEGGSSVPASTLRLNEVFVVPNEYAKNLVSTIGLNTNKGNNNAVFLGSKDSLNNILDISDFDESIWNSIHSNQLRSVKFTYDYELCYGVPNSFYKAGKNLSVFEDHGGGKLTLKKISFYGQNGLQKIMPDFRFNYGTTTNENPNYSKDKFDGWGFYSNTASDHTSFKKSTSSGDQWSLKEIINPTGSKLKIDYERDSYSTVSGYPTSNNFLGGFEDNVFYAPWDPSTVRSIFLIGDVASEIPIGTSVYIHNLQCYTYINQNRVTADFSGFYTVVNSTSPHHIDIDIGQSPDNHEWRVDRAHTNYEGNGLSIYVPSKIGDGIRVKSIRLIDEVQNEIETRYVYTTDGQIGSKTSGVCTMEPEYIHVGVGIDKQDQYNQYDFPGPKVYYGKVSVYTNYKSINDYLSKNVYEFVTPSLNLVEESHRTIGDPRTYLTKFEYWDYWYNYQSKYYKTNHWLVNHLVKNKTAVLGSLKSITTYSSNHKYKKVSYVYEDMNQEIDFSVPKIGLYTEGSMMTEKLYEAGEERMYLKTLYTRKLTIPLKLKSFTIEENGLSKTVENTKWDFITGAVEETEYENAYGDRYRTKVVPAYQKYDEMGHILWDKNNKHLLSKPAAKYLYVKDETDNGWNLIAASADVWSNQWNYREYNETTDQWEWSGVYTNDAWRRKGSYAWKALINPDGTYVEDANSSNKFVDFDWTNPTANPNWVSSGSIEKYNHNSVMIENKSTRDVYSTQRTDNSNLYSVVQASDAKYAEVLYSGAEDKLTSHGNEWYFNQEVLQGAGSIIETTIENVHTGKKALKINQAGFGFVYRTNDVGGDIDVNRSYQVSVWVKNALNVAIRPTSAMVHVQYRQGGKSGTILHAQDYYLSQNNSLKAGDWYLFTVDLPKHNGTSIDIQSADYMEIQTRCMGASGEKIYVDDFRFYPLTSTVTTTVYDYKNGLKTAVLNNLNIASKVTYDFAGKAIKVEQEVFDSEASDGVGGFKTKVEKKYNYGPDLN